jgi:HAD superfamily hydrolase (TIGR01459 family)
MKHIDGIAEIAEKYDYFIFDVWGVVHDGSSLYPQALETFEYLNKIGKKICFLSNAPRRASKVEKTLNDFGITKDLYEFILTSGESGYLDLEQNQKNNFVNFGKNYFYIGPSKDIDLLDGLDYKKVENPSKADFVLTTGFENEYSKISEKLPLAIQANEFKLPMLCVNPDLIVVKQNGVEMICAGALALEYQKMGGVVNYYGKPFSKVYQMVLEKFSIPSEKKVIAIGDGLETDIKGANDFKIDSVLVTGGILSKDLGIKFWQVAEDEKLNKICNSYKIFPNYIISNLRI